MSLLYGKNEALERVKDQMSQRNTGKIMYPNGTNDRGYPSTREAHARGDMVGGELPSKGGSHMSPMHGKRDMMGGVEKRNQRNAVDQQRSNHASGGQPRTCDMDDMNKDRESHKFGAGIKGDFKNLGHTIKKGFKKEIGDPFKKEITNPSRKVAQKIEHGANKAIDKTRQTANMAKRGAESGAKAVKEGAQATGRAVRNEYRKG